MPQPKYPLRRCSGYRRPMASGAAASRSDSEPASAASRELPARAHFQWRCFPPCRRCLASGTASSRGAAQSATHTSTTSRRDNRSRAPPRYSRHCLKPCQIIVDDWPCHNPCVLRKNHDGVCRCAYHRIVRPDGFADTVMEPEAVLSLHGHRTYAGTPSSGC